MEQLTWLELRDALRNTPEEYLQGPLQVIIGEQNFFINEVEKQAFDQHEITPAWAADFAGLLAGLQSVPEENLSAVVNLRHSGNVYPILRVEAMEQDYYYLRGEWRPIEWYVENKYRNYEELPVRAENEIFFITK